MSTLFGSAAQPQVQQTQGDLKNDVALTDPPEDSISDLAFSTKSEHLAIASWDKKVRIYEIDGQGRSQGKALFEHEQPVLSCCWTPVRPTPPCDLFRSMLTFFVSRMAVK